ncbi:VOC family protein [Sphingobacterium psychroaquaticum]|uniref:VOC family protein n=1 Tax=Sphingobacterium psychroaquaticum TaxID=561061 RepID=UPI00106A973A|nr:VOC family protein [Sphingobacterium psychroaquaticum]QBQ41843.1 VOC family protein [Sphingobacterium psychroaquaticum]
MAKVHFYLNFNGNCDEAFTFYQSVFEVPSLGTHRFGDMPEDPHVTIPAEQKNKVLHTALQINEQVMLMGSDCVEGFGPKVTFGTGTYIMLDTDTPEEAQKLHARLTKDAQNIEMDLGETFFAELFSSFIDQFGIAWMVHYEGNKKLG